MNKLLFSAILTGLLICSNNAWSATTLLPPGMQCFTTANGAVISGSINMFFVGTTNPKPTWQDSNQTTLNSQPIQLDGNGCATIFGVGSYRQELFDGPVVAGSTTGNLIFDKITTDTSAYNAVFWAGTSGGTPNVITVVDPGFNGTDGSVINFTALATNTGSVTVNPSGFGPVLVVKDTAAGPVVLTGGEIVQNNVISLIYNAAGNQFHLVNTAIPSAAGNQAPLCGANNLKIQNSVGTPNTIITVTADTALMVNPAGLVINRANVNQSINISTGTITSTAGGMDGEAIGVSNWLYLWLIDNGAAPAGLATSAAGNGLAPTMPSGYTYKCRMGAMRVDGAGILLRTLQKGALAQYTLVSPSNTQQYPSVGSTASATFAPMATGPVVPPTASTIKVISANATVNAQDAISPNAVPFTIGSAGGGAPVCAIIHGPGGSQGVLTCDFTLESTNIFVATNLGTAVVNAIGWRDQVNAN